MTKDMASLTTRGQDTLCPNQSTTIAAVLPRFFDILFPAALLFGGIALGISLYRSLYYGWYATALLHASMYLFSLIALLFRRRIPVRILLALFLGLVFISVIHSLCTMGLMGEGMMTLALACVFSGIFFGIQTGIVVTVAGILLAISIGAGVSSGLIAIRHDSLELLYHSPTWMVHSALLALYVVPIILIINTMHKRIAEPLHALKEMNERLKEEISARDDVEKRLRESEAKYRDIFENALEGIFQGSPDGRLLTVNPALARMGRFDSPEDMTQSVADLNHDFYVCPLSRDEARRQLEHQGFIEGFETEMFRKDGTTGWVSLNARVIRDDHGTPVLIEGTIEDITKRKTAEKERFESELKYRSVVENSLVAFSIEQDNRFRFVNSRFCAMTGYDYDEIIGKKGLADMVQPDERERVSAEIRMRLSQEGGPDGPEIRILTKDGVPVMVKAMWNILIYDQRPAIFGAFIDITHEKSLESKLIQSQKMEAIGTLTGGIAHDFNNILTALIGFGTMLHMKLDESDPLRRYTTGILSASEKAASLTQSLLTFSRLQPVMPKPVDVNAAIQDTEKLLRRLLTEDIDLRLDLSPENITVLADLVQINQILFNLVANARDAMPKGGVLAIKTKMAYLDNAFIQRNGFGKTGTYGLLSVCDTGIGMDETTVQKVFDPFFTTKEAGKGTGLGLSSVYGIVKQHQGYILVQSKANQGTSIHIYFPVIKAVSAETGDTADETCLRNGRETILIAEDDDITRRLIREVLANYGYRVIEATDGEDAVQKFQHHQDIALVIADSIMPKKSGGELHDIIKELRPDIPTLFISGHPKDLIQAKGFIDQSVDFMPKPLYPDKFMTKVGEIIERNRRRG